MSDPPSHPPLTSMPPPITSSLTPRPPHPPPPPPLRIPEPPSPNPESAHDPSNSIAAADTAAAAAMVCAGARAVSLLKFVGTVSLGLLTGVSYTVSTLTLPTLLRLPSSAAASQAISSLTDNLKAPVFALTALASAPLFLSFVLSPRSARHPYLVYTALLAVLSTAAPRFLPQPTPRPAASASKKTPPRSARMEASYEVLGDVHSEATSEEEIEDINGEEVRVEVESLARGYVVRTGLAALGFAMAVVGIWGDGAPQAVVYVS